MVPDDLSQGLKNKRSYSSHLTSLQIQDEINKIEQVLNLPKTVNTYRNNFENEKKIFIKT